MEDNFPRILIENVKKLGMSSKKEATRNEVRLLTRISFEAEVPAGKMAKLMYIYERGEPINVIFECPQAEVRMED